MSISSFFSNISNITNIYIVDSDCSSDNKSTTFNHSSPKITYIVEPSGVKFDEAKRVIALAYSYDQNRNVKYGASIFKKINKNDICIKSQIRETALDRFNKNPVCFNMSDVVQQDDKIRYDQVIKEIRYKMYKYGVKGRESIYDSLTNTYSDNSSNATSSSNSSNNLIGLNSSNNSNDSKSNDSESYEKKSLISNEYNEPKISYILEPKGSTWQNANRIIAIVYSYTSNEISYGASIFRRTFPNEACVKAHIRNTALDRFYKEPIILEKKNYNGEKITVTKVLQIIRKTMYKAGVKQNKDFIENNISI